MKKLESKKDIWETPSLDWIHRVRRERQMEREGRILRPLSRKESERLASRYGLKLVGYTTVNR